MDVASSFFFFFLATELQNEPRCTLPCSFHVNAPSISLLERASADLSVELRGLRLAVRVMGRNELCIIVLNLSQCCNSWPETDKTPEAEMIFVLQ